MMCLAAWLQGKQKSSVASHHEKTNHHHSLSSPSWPLTGVELMNLAFRTVREDRRLPWPRDAALRSIFPSSCTPSDQHSDRMTATAKTSRRQTKVTHRLSIGHVTTTSSSVISWIQYAHRSIWIQYNSKYECFIYTLKETTKALKPNGNKKHQFYLICFFASFVYTPFMLRFNEMSVYYP